LRERKYQEERKRIEEERELKRVEREKRYLEDEEERRLKREGGSMEKRDTKTSSRSPRRSSSPRSRHELHRNGDKSNERRGRSRTPVDKLANSPESTPTVTVETEVAKTRKRRRFASQSKSKSPVKAGSEAHAKDISVSPHGQNGVTPSSE
jgi:hypothetical protein